MFYLPGDKWDNIELSGISSMFLVIIKAGKNYYLSTSDIDIREELVGDCIHFTGAIINNITYKEEVDIFSYRYNVKNFSFDIMGRHFPIVELRKNGVVLQNIKVDIYWYIKNIDLTLSDAFHIMNGYLTEPRYDEVEDIVSFTVEEMALELEDPFPPVVISTKLINNVVDEFVGKPYPIVIGSVKKLPVLDIDSVVPGVTWLVMLDKLNEFVSGSFVSTVYKGDESVSISTQDSGVDTEGNRYWYIELSSASDSKDITVDVTGYTPSTVKDVLLYFLNFYTNKGIIFDQHSLNLVEKNLGVVELAMMFNGRTNSNRGGILNTIFDRLSKQIPFIITQQNNKYGFWPIIWDDKNPVKILSFDKNIVKKIDGPTETKRSNIYNNLTIKYNISGLRGDYTGCIIKNSNNNFYCKQSKNRYGSRHMPDINLPDVSNVNGANYIADWNIETYSKMRVFISYECTLDVINVHLLDNVRVIDEYENFDTVFKVIGIERIEGSVIGLSLISINDYTEIYGVV